MVARKAIALLLLALALVSCSGSSSSGSSSKKKEIVPEHGNAPPPPPPIETVPTGDPHISDHVMNEAWNPSIERYPGEYDY